MADCNILIIDDDLEFLLASQEMLQRAGRQVCIANTADQAIEEFKSRKPHIIFCDMMMQEVDSGIRIVKELRKLCNDLPIYLTSSIADVMMRNQDIYELGFSGATEKPLTSEFVNSLLNQD